MVLPNESTLYPMLVQEGSALQAVAAMSTSTCLGTLQSKTA